MAPFAYWPTVDPAGPVQPLDVPDVGTIPVGDKTSIGVEDGNAVISTEIGGTRVDLRLPIGDRQTPSGQGPTLTPATPPAQPQPVPATPP